jgi:hypothetical protein
MPENCLLRSIFRGMLLPNQWVRSDRTADGPARPRPPGSVQQRWSQQAARSPILQRPADGSTDARSPIPARPSPARRAFCVAADERSGAAHRAGWRVLDRFFAAWTCRSRRSTWPASRLTRSLPCPTAVCSRGPRRAPGSKCLRRTTTPRSESGRMANASCAPRPQTKPM